MVGPGDPLELYICSVGEETARFPPPNFPKGSFPFFSEAVCGGGLTLPPFFQLQVGVPAEYPECFCELGESLGCGSCLFSMCLKSVPRTPTRERRVYGDGRGPGRRPSAALDNPPCRN